MAVGQTPIDYETQCQGFRVLLKQCLNLQQGDDLLVIYDESLTDFFEALVNVVETDSIPTTFVCIPKSYQRRLVRAAGAGTSLDRMILPSGLVSAISNSTGIINLLDGEPENAGLRRTVNHTGRVRLSRLATIPGISPEILRTIARSPTDEILADCERVAWALGEAHHAELVSYASDGRRYALGMDLDGWDGEPIMSPGVLLPGSWGNVPPGETFCCPPHETVNGEVCINGSVPGSILREGHEVVLRFERGKLVDWRSPGGPASSGPAFFDAAKARGERYDDPNWGTFAELGIGLNPVVTELTGNSLFDEKAKGSVHVGIGDNSNFGDKVVSFFHADLVTWRPDLRLDGRDVITRGELLSSRIDELRAATPRTEELPPDVTLKLREARVDRHEGVWKRRLSKAHRVNYVAMAGGPISHALGRFITLLKDYETVKVRDFLEQNPTIGGIESSQLLWILNHYRVLHVTRSSRTDVTLLGPGAVPRPGAEGSNVETGR